MTASRDISRPRPGWFRTRMVRGGVFVGARIRYEPTRDPETGEPMERSWYWWGDVDGRSDPNPSPSPSQATLRIWTGAEEIDEAEYRYLIKDAEWCQINEPDHPRANPTKAVDFLTAKLPF